MSYPLHLASLRKQGDRSVPKKSGFALLSYLSISSRVDAALPPMMQKEKGGKGQRLWEENNRRPIKGAQIDESTRTYLRTFFRSALTTTILSSYLLLFSFFRFLFRQRRWQNRSSQSTRSTHKGSAWPRPASFAPTGPGHMRWCRPSRCRPTSAKRDGRPPVAPAWNSASTNGPSSAGNVTQLAKVTDPSDKRILHLIHFLYTNSFRPYDPLVVQFIPKLVSHDRSARLTDPRSEIVFPRCPVKKQTEKKGKRKGNPLSSRRLPDVEEVTGSSKQCSFREDSLPLCRPLTVYGWRAFSGSRKKELRATASAWNSIQLCRFHLGNFESEKIMKGSSWAAKTT